MELNFNSVEMSSKPNAEASSLDYVEAPLTFNSVEIIPVLNASAAFKTYSGKVFKEDVKHSFLDIAVQSYVIYCPAPRR